MHYHKSSNHVVVKKHSWHYILFRESLEVVDAWRGSKGKYVEKYAYGTTLSHYLRVMLFYMPLAVLSNVALYIWISLSLFIIPLLAGGPAKYALFLVILILLGFILFCIEYFIRIWAKSENSIFGLILMNWFGVYERPKRTDIGTIGLFKRWVTLRFTGVNPNVTFTEGQANE